MTDTLPSPDTGAMDSITDRLTTRTTTAAATDIYDNISYEDALDDVHTRFILNLPSSELRTADRIFVQLEQAWWYYEDFICDPRPHLDYLPRYNHLRPFAKELFEYSTVLPDATQFNEMWKQYSIYKKKISNYGCILLSSDYQRIVLCQVYNGKSYTLPSGKINEGEDGAAAAARETYEETGFDPSCRYGLTASWLEESPPQHITWDTQFQHPKNKLVHQEEDHTNKRRTCYVIVGVPEDFPFAPVCRKEVSNIEWFNLDQVSSIPTFAVMPFVKPLKKWIHKQLQQKQKSAAAVGGATQESQPTLRDHSNPKNRNAANSKKSRDKNKTSTPQRNSRANSRHRDRDGQRIIEDHNDTDHIISSGLAKSGDQLRWTEEDMFKVNAQILGRNVTSEYDGNPHLFTEEGLSKMDPHAYRIVGGALLNQHSHPATGATTSTTNSHESTRPDPSQLQSLVHQRSDNDDDFLTPFFSHDGATPWGEVIPGVQPPVLTTAAAAATSQSKKSKPPRNKKNTVADARGTDDVIPTDAQITANRHVTTQISILKKPPPPVAPPKVAVASSSNNALLYRRQGRQEQYHNDLSYIQNWVANLPNPQNPHQYFGAFTLDADVIMAQAARDIQKYPSVTRRDV